YGFVLLTFEQRAIGARLPGLLALPPGDHLGHLVGLVGPAVDPFRQRRLFLREVVALAHQVEVHVAVDRIDRRRDLAGLLALQDLAALGDDLGAPAIAVR